MEDICMALTVLNKTQRQKLEVIQNRCLQYARRADCNIVRVEQRLIALPGKWWKKASNKNDDIINFTYHHQPNNKTKAPLNIIKVISSSNPCTTL